MRSSFRLLAATVSTIALLTACATATDTPEVAAAVIETPPAEPEAPAAGQEATPPATATEQADIGNAWAQATSDIPADEDVRFGQLPNGMRYALMKNATPPGQASLRLRIDAGSLQERDDQQGLAHFIEHMAFNGTAGIPEGDLLPILERLGLAFGPDTNASTSFDQTVYMLDLPNTAPSSVDTGLMILREMVGEATLAADAIDRERGIVISEERTRDGPALRAIMARYGFLMKDQRVPTRFPIGQVEILANAPRDALADFYEAYYRPERATLVVVGDFDVDAMEAKIKAEFSDWTNPSPEGADPDLGEVQPRGPEARIHVEPGAQTSLQIAWVSPPDLDPDQLEERVETMVRDLGLAVLNRRLQALARSEDPPFIAAGASRSTELRSIDNASIFASVKPGQWKAALQALEKEKRKIEQFGVTPAELRREITELRAAYETYVAGAETRRTPSLAEAISNSVNEDDVFTAPETDLTIFNQVAELVTAEMVSEVLKSTFEGQGPLIFLTTPTPIEGGGADILNALAESQAVTVEPNAVVEALPWPYTDFGAPATVTSREEIADLEATKVVLSNGVRLTVKPTSFRDDQILVSVRTGQGLQQLPTDETTPMWAVGSAFSEGGLGKLTREQLEETLAADVYGVGLGPDEDAYTLSGGTRPEDFELQMQVLAAYFTDAAWRPEPFERLRGAYLQILPQLEATPGGVFQRDSGRLLHDGDARWAFPSREQLEGASLDELKALTTAGLADGPIEITIVGDIDVDTAIAGVASTFGALPARGGFAEPASPNVSFPEPTAEPIRLTHTGRADQALGFVAWPAPAAVDDMHETRLVRLVADVLRLRLIDELREGQAVTYSPSVGATSSWTFPGYGYVSASIQAPPDKMEGFFADVDRIVAELASTPVTADELERARRPRVEALTRSQASNEFWLSELQDLHRDENRLEAIRTALSDLEAATPEDLQRVAQAYLLADKAWRLTVTPENAAE